jgi:hypothetical protein
MSRGQPPRYVATTLDGLARVLSDEARHQVQATVLHTAPGFAVFDATAPPQAVSGLRCADRIWAYVREVAIDLSAHGGRSGSAGAGLRTLRTKLRRTSFARSLTTLRALRPRARSARQPQTFRLITSLGADVGFPYFTVHQSIADALADASGWSPSPSAADVTILALAEAAGVTLGLLLPRPGDWPGRDHAEEPLRVLAAAVVWLTRPRPDDVFLDLSPKGAFVPAERQARGTCRIVAPGDDLTRLAAGDGTVTKLAGCFSGRPVKPGQMPSLAAEIGRVLAKGGLAVLAALREVGLAHSLEQALGRPLPRLRARLDKREYQVAVVEGGA